LVAEGKEITVDEAITGSTNDILIIKGLGRVNLSGNSPDFHGSIFIRGAELRLHGVAEMHADTVAITIENGGTLTLDHPSFHKDFVSIHKSRVTLNAGTIHLIGADKDDTGEGFGTLSFTGGANTIDIKRNGKTYSNHLHANTALEHSKTATLNLTGNTDYGIYWENIRVGYAQKSGSFLKNGIVPWATIKGSTWATTVLGGDGLRYFVPFTDYQTMPEAYWKESDNITLVGNEGLTANRRINSLRIAIPTLTLNLAGNNTLYIDSGGILTTVDTGIRGLGRLTTLGNSPLYIHTYERSLTLENGVQLGNEPSTGSEVDLVKTGSGALILSSGANHRLGTITINQGIIKALKGYLHVLHKVIIGDGAGNDVLELATASKNQIRGAVNKLPSVTLHGNPYGAASDEAILRLGGNTQQQLATLHIQDRGTIDFLGAAKHTPNILYIDQLTFNNTNAILTIRNWNYESDYLLVRKTWGDVSIPPVLNQIRFAGFDGPALWHFHILGGFGDYWQITAVPAPEPSTYGALLASAGVGLCLWRRRRARAGNHCE